MVIDPIMVMRVISFVAPLMIRQIDKFAHQIDWSIVEKKAKERVSAMLPGEMFDEMGREVVVKAINVAKEFFEDEAEMMKILELCKQKKYMEAITDLEKYLLEKIVG